VSMERRGSARTLYGRRVIVFTFDSSVLARAVGSLARNKPTLRDIEAQRPVFRLLLGAAVVFSTPHARNSARSIATTEPMDAATARGVAGAKLAGRGSGRAPAWCDSNVGAVVLPFVGEEAAFDGPYNIRLHPTHGARSRAPRVPALRCIVTPRGAGEPNR